MNRIINLNLSRREFIKEFKGLARLGFIGFLGIPMLGKCTGTEPPPDDLDPPFICTNLCDATSQSGITNPQTTGTSPTILIFSGYNKESGFVGYNVWYGIQGAITSSHAAKNRSLVIDKTGSKTIDASNLGSSLPTLSTTETVNQTRYIELTVNNTVSGNYLYVTAYNPSENIDSLLSNGYLIP